MTSPPDAAHTGLLRDRFPTLERLTYLNSCSRGLLAREVEGAVHSYLDDWRTHGSPWETWVGKLEQARASFARLVNADPDEIAVTTSVSAAISALASGVSFSGERTRVVASDFEFPTVGQAWLAQEPRGAEVTIADEAGGVVPMAAWESAIDERTAAVSVAHVCYRNGAMQDVEAIRALAHERGALLVADAYQSLGTLPVDVRAWDVDVLLGGALKYLLGAEGVAFMYVRRELWERLDPSVTGWFAQADPMAMDHRRHRPAPNARRFESGTPPVPNLYATIAGLEIIHEVGTDAIEAHLGALTSALKDAALERGWRLATPVDAHGPQIALASTDVEALVQRLAEEEIVVSSRDGNLRVSPHLYNHLGDIERLVGALGRHEGLLERV